MIISATVNDSPIMQSLIRSGCCWEDVTMFFGRVHCRRGFPTAKRCGDWRCCSINCFLLIWREATGCCTIPSDMYLLIKTTLILWKMWILSLYNSCYSLAFLNKYLKKTTAVCTCFFQMTDCCFSSFSQCHTHTRKHCLNNPRTVMRDIQDMDCFHLTRGCVVITSQGLVLVGWLSRQQYILQELSHGQILR